MPLRNSPLDRSHITPAQAVNQLISARIVCGDQILESQILESQILEYQILES